MTLGEYIRSRYVLEKQTIKHVCGGASEEGIINTHIVPLPCRESIVSHIPKCRRVAQARSDTLYAGSRVTVLQPA